MLGTAKTDSRGYARFDAGLTRGEGGLAPAVLVAETPDGDYAFLDLADRGLRPDRPRRQGPQPRRARIDVFAYTDRGVYRPGETVHLTALVRDAPARPSRRAGHA